MMMVLIFALAFFSMLVTTVRGSSFGATGRNRLHEFIFRQLLVGYHLVGRIVKL